LQYWYRQLIQIISLIYYIYIVLIIGFVPAIISIFKEKSNSLKAVSPFLWLTAFASLYELIISLLLRLDVSFWLIFYEVISFVFLSFFYIKTFNRQFFKIIFSFYCLIIFGLLFFLFLRDKHNNLELQVYTSPIILIMVLVFTFLWFRKIYLAMEIPILFKESSFYYISAFFLYYTSTFFLFLLSDFLFRSDPTSFSDYWILNVVATFIFRILLSIGVWMEPRK